MRTSGLFHLSLFILAIVQTSGEQQQQPPPKKNNVLAVILRKAQG